MGALSIFGSHQYAWNCNGCVDHGSFVIIQSTRQINCVCEGWGWQFVHPCMSFYFNDKMCSFGIDNSLARIMFWTKHINMLTMIWFTCVGFWKVSLKVVKFVL